MQMCESSEKYQLTISGPLPVIGSSLILRYPLSEFQDPNIFSNKTLTRGLVRLCCSFPASFYYRNLTKNSFGINSYITIIMGQLARIWMFMTLVLLFSLFADLGAADPVILNNGEVNLSKLRAF